MCTQQFSRLRIFFRNCFRTSFEIIPVQDNENKSPVYHEEHSLGLASWCVQPLYCYAYGRLIDLRRSDHRREDPATVSRWLMGALLLNPDVSTFWNMRRELVRNGRLDALSELRFSTIVLFYKAKCFEAFAYRRWLVNYLLVGDKTPRSDAETLLGNEIKVAGISADRYANNYHAWSHREYVVASHEKNLPESYEKLLKAEWNDSGKWCSRHVSDHSGLAYRQFLLKRLLFQRNTERSDLAVAKEELAERREFVKRLVVSCLASDERLRETTSRDVDSWEFLDILHNTKTERRADVDYDRTLVALSYWAEDCKNNENNIVSYPGHEALWYHRRFLAYALVVLCDSYRRHNCYRVENLTQHWPRPQSVAGSPSTEESVDDRAADEHRGPAGPLLLAFTKDNDRIVELSRSLRSQPQTSLGEKFVKYMSDYSADLVGSGER